MTKQIKSSQTVHARLCLKNGKLLWL